MHHITTRDLASAMSEYHSQVEEGWKTSNPGREEETRRKDQKVESKTELFIWSNDTSWLHLVIIRDQKSTAGARVWY